MNLELFPCSGGMAEGFRRAGVAFDVAIDHDADACDSYEKNLGHRPLQMDVNDFHRLVIDGWRPPGGVDLLVADPPCTPWSRAGKREGLADDRDCLVVTADLIRLLRPRAYLIGNVPGLQDSTQWNVVQRVIGGLRNVGYCVRDYVNLDAADYGVPQHRMRPFWFGHLDGPCVVWPAPTHAAPTEQLAIGGHALAPWVTCRASLGHLSLEELGRPVKMRIREKGEDGTKHGGDVTRCSSPDLPGKTVMVKDSRKGGQILIPNDRHPMSEMDAPAKTVTGVRASRGAQGGRALLVNDRHPLAASYAPSPTIRGGGSGHSAPQVVLSTAVEHPRHPVSSLDEPGDAVTTDPARVGAGPGQVLEWPWNRPATTVSATDERLPKVGHHGSGSGSSTQHGPNAIVLSEKAAAILQGFPDGWLFSGDTKRARWGQIGMAMPPPLAHAVATSVAQQIRAASTEAA